MGFDNNKEKRVKEHAGGRNGMSAGSIIVALIISAVWLYVNYYIYYPALNIQSTVFWEWLMFHSVIVTLVFIFCGIVGRREKSEKIGRAIKRNGEYFIKGRGKLQIITLFLVPIFCLLVIVFGNLAGAPIFNAKKYASLLKVDNRDFVEDIHESENVDNIALMDTNSARIFGDRKIGSLSDVVSQFEVESAYTQINIDNKPMKVANLKYADFFKYLSNKSDGIPGYVTVNPVDSTAKYVKLDKGMKYVPSGYFNDKIMRHVQMGNPTKIFEGCYFEVKDDGTPCYICPVLHARVGLFAGMDVKGAVICDPVSGDMQYYDVADIPTWVDRVYDGELLERKYNWYGIYSNGYWNSIVGQKGCVQTTNDYGYKTIEDDVWIYTGVTSVTGDASNIGFVMINQRTSEARYYAISGAEEYSAMASAEGEVQEKKYTASFPSLINVDGNPTYIMVMVDNGGLVKMYAMVNVEQYNLVATGESQSEVFAKYRKLLKSEGVGNGKKKTVDSSDEESIDDIVDEETFVVDDIIYVTTGGETFVYIKDNKGNVYKQPFAEDENIVFVSEGDVVKITYENIDGSDIREIIDVDIEKKGENITDYEDKSKVTVNLITDKNGQEGTVNLTVDNNELQTSDEDVSKDSEDTEEGQEDGTE